MKRLLDLSKLNLNLLISLKALLEERNVSLAADKLNFTQPTMSRNLAHLRLYFQDPLLVRSGKEYILSSCAQELKHKLDSVIEGIGALFTMSFQPALDEREFIFAAPDYVVQYVLSDVLTFLFTIENHLRFNIKNWDAVAKEQLIAGDIHLAISIDNKFPPNMYQRAVDEDSLVVAARAGHPIATSSPLTNTDFVAYPHIAVMTGGGWNDIIDRPLRELGLRRKIKLKVCSYAAALSVVKRTDLLAVMPFHVARNSRDVDSLAVLPLPFTMPKVQMSLWWHECHQNDPAHRWLREELFPKILHHPYQLGLSVHRIAELAGLNVPPA